MSFWRFQWFLGTSMVAASICQGAYITHGLHKKQISAEQYAQVRRSLDEARTMTMLNGLGLCMITLKAKSRLSAFPTGMILASTLMYPGVLFYETITEDKRFHRLIPIIDVSSILAWLIMGLI